MSTAKYRDAVALALQTAPSLLASVAPPVSFFKKF
jgi:hypothetical protein